MVVEVNNEATKPALDKVLREQSVQRIYVQIRNIS